MQEIEKTVFNFLAVYGIQVLGALIILTAGALVARWVRRVADQWFVRKQIEPPLRMLAGRVIWLLVFGLSVVLGVNGEVTDVQLFTTTLLHTDQSRVVIPNRKIVGEILHNYGTIRQLNPSVGVSYDTELNETLGMVREILQRNPRVLKNPAPVVGVTLLGDSSVDIAIKPWVAVKDYLVVGGEIYQAVLEDFRRKDIEMPFPQREVRLLADRQGPKAMAAETRSSHT